MKNLIITLTLLLGVMSYGQDQWVGVLHYTVDNEDVYYLGPRGEIANGVGFCRQHLSNSDFLNLGAWQVGFRGNRLYLNNIIGNSLEPDGYVPVGDFRSQLIERTRLRGYFNEDVTSAPNPCD